MHAWPHAWLPFPDSREAGCVTSRAGIDQSTQLNTYTSLSTPTAFKISGPFLLKQVKYSIVLIRLYYRNNCTQRQQSCRLLCRSHRGRSNPMELQARPAQLQALTRVRSIAPVCRHLRRRRARRLFLRRRLRRYHLDGLRCLVRSHCCLPCVDARLVIFV